MLTNESRNVMEFLLSSQCMVHEPISKETKTILRALHKQIAVAYVTVTKITRTKGYAVVTHSSKATAPMPKSFPISSFPKAVYSHILKAITNSVSYTLDLVGHRVIITFAIEGPVNMKECDDHVFYILVWLHIAYANASSSCADSIAIYFYMTSLKKVLPRNKEEILGQLHVNTGFTFTCPAASEIVIFRREEWFKVLIHESWHTFGFDFAEMDLTQCHSHILSRFNVKSEVNLFESYVEFWAEIMNSAICSFFLTKDKSSVAKFYKYFESFVHLERAHKYFQLVKILRHMGTNYEEIITRDTPNRYREDTNILSYYVLTAILMHDYQRFLKWCKVTNVVNIFQFTNTQKALTSFCQHFDSVYNSSSLVRLIRCGEDLLENTLSVSSGNFTFILENTRMSIIEAS